ncbi:3499_t:CDS:1, partial [Scutellospora calospora]
FWDPTVFYFYGTRDSGKTSLVQTLVGEELYDKPIGTWDGYDGQEIVLLDKYHKKIEWMELMRVLHDNKYMVETERGKIVPFVAKYIFITNRKTPKEAHELSEDDDNNYNVFEDRLDYIVQFDGKWNDNIRKRDLELVFHKGDERKFQKIEWDVEYNNDEIDNDELIDMGEEFVRNVKGKHFERNGKVYWRPEFPDYLKRYLREYPKCKELYKYIREENKKTISYRNNVTTSSKKKTEGRSSLWSHEGGALGYQEKEYY